MPGIRAALKSCRLPAEFLALAVQIVAKERGLYIFAELSRRFVTSERNHPDALSLLALPLPVIPRPGHDEVVVLRIVFLGVAKNLPRSPRILLIPEPAHIQVGHGRPVQLINPPFFPPKVIVIRMLDIRIPERNRVVKIFGVDVRQRPQIQIPLI